MSYWLIKSLLLAGLLLVASFMLRPVKNASHLAIRRLGVVFIVVLAGAGVLFPELVSRAARFIGVDSGVNLLVYFLFLVVFTQMATSYRRDTVTEEKITQLARAVALATADKPPTPAVDVSDSSPTLAKDDGDPTN